VAGVAEAVTISGSEPDGSINADDDCFMVGALGAGNAQNANIKVGHACYWDVILTAEEMAALAAGVNPMRVRRDALVVYVPLMGDHLAEVAQGLPVTLISAPPTFDDPPVAPMFAGREWPAAVAALTLARNRARFATHIAT